MEGRRFGQIVIYLIKWLKKLNSQFLLLYLRYMGEGLVENVIWGRESKIALKPSYI